MEEIKKGDLVRFKSGGPIMIVLNPDNGLFRTGETAIRCEWFDNIGHLHESSFRKFQLIIQPETE